MALISTRPAPQDLPPDSSDQFFPLGLAVSMGGLSLSAGFAVGSGLGFGLYPAWLASRMDPVESLRAT